MAGNRVLFVDDDPILSLEVCLFLREFGFGVAQAASAADAYEAIDRRAPLTALVTDINLGPGPDGFEVARRARLVYPDLRVIYISGTAMDRYAAEGLKGAQFIAKPLHPRQIVEALRRESFREASSLSPVAELAPDFGGLAAASARRTSPPQRFDGLKSVSLDK